MKLLIPPIKYNSAAVPMDVIVEDSSRMTSFPFIAYYLTSIILDGNLLLQYFIGAACTRSMIYLYN